MGRALTIVRNNGVALVALIVALGGTSYAAITLPRGSVTSREVRNHSLQRRDFRPGQVPKGATGPAGRDGATGPVGPQGPQGPPGPGLRETYARTSPSVDLCASGAPCDAGTATAHCPIWAVVTGGGYQTDSPQVVVTVSKMAGDVWTVSATNRDDVPHSFTAEATCAAVPSQP